MNPDAAQIGGLAREALIREAILTPKPGLVDAASRGAHTDMDLSLLIASVDALAPFFTRFAARGMRDAAQRIDGRLSAIRAEGMEGEAEMLTATGGVNTHKGALFLLGLLSYAAGYCAHGGEPLQPVAVCAAAARACRGVTDELRSGAGRAFARYGARGARGEAEDGYPHALDALAVYLRSLRRGASEEEAWLLALLRLISRVEDSNVLARCGKRKARKLRARAKKIAVRFPRGGAELAGDIRRLDRLCVEWNASPGGSADLLACAMFLSALAAQE